MGRQAWQVGVRAGKCSQGEGEYSSPPPTTTTPNGAWGGVSVPPVSLLTTGSNTPHRQQHRGWEGQGWGLGVGGGVCGVCHQQHLGTLGGQVVGWGASGQGKANGTGARGGRAGPTHPPPNVPHQTITEQSPTTIKITSGNRPHPPPTGQWGGVGESVRGARGGGGAGGRGMHCKRPWGGGGGGVVRGRVRGVGRINTRCKGQGAPWSVHHPTSIITNTTTGKWGGV